MNESMIKDFQNRIVNAGKGDLLIINYEMLFIAINEAMLAIEESDEDKFSKVMIRAHKLLRELSDNLDFNYDISRDLMSIYIYANKQFIDASLQFSKKPLDNAKDVLMTLFSAWQEIEKKVDDSPIVTNGQRVYAGLTYGKSALNETVCNDVVGRGFKA